MRNRVVRALVALGAAGLMAGAMVAPASAGGKTPSEVLPSLTVEKIVVAGETSYDVSGLFTVQVACADFETDASAQGGGPDGFTAELTFNPDGTPHAAPGGWVDTGTAWSLQGWDLKRVTCTVTEQAGGAAVNLVEGSPTYTCAFTNEKWVDESVAPEDKEEGPPPGCLSTDGSSPAMVRLGSPYDHSCQEPAEAEGGGCYCVQSAYVTVTNEIAEDPAKVASEAVVIQPKFTG